MAIDPEVARWNAMAQAYTTPVTTPTYNFGTTAYNPLYGNPLNTTTAPTISVPAKPEPPAAVPQPVPAASGPMGPKTYTQAEVDKMLADAKTTAAAASTATRQNAFDAFKARFAALGLGSLADSMVNIVKSPNAPTTADGYYLALLDTPEYQDRFGKTNAARIKNGLPALSEGEILTAESKITTAMKAMGMPAGFYDQPEDLRTFIANDKGAPEVTDIIKAYQDVARNLDPDTTKQLQDLYNIDLGSITAHLMDPTKAQPILAAIAQKGTLGAAAATAGIQDVAGAAQAGGTYGAGTLDYTKQAQGFATAQLLGQQAGTLSNIYGGNYNTAQGMQEAFNASTAIQAETERKRLAALQTSSFGGSAGASQPGQSLGVGNAQGVI